MSSSAALTGRISSSVAGVLAGIPARGTVHSLFQRSFNVALGEVLLNVQPADGHLAAFGIALDDATVRDLIAALRVGDLVRVQGERLRFYPTYGDPVAVDLGSLREQDLAVPAGRMGGEHNAALREAIGALDLGPHLGIGMDEAFLTHTAALASAEPDDAALRDAYAWLIGRGTGLTPSGDDIVMGYAFWLLARAGQAVDPRLIALMQGRTTEISVTFMRMLDRGYISESYVALCRALAAGRHAEMRETLTRIARIGHSSGRDSLYGIWLATQRMAGDAQ